MSPPVASALSILGGWVLGWLSGCGQPEEERGLVAAASSLRELVEAANAEFQARFPGDELEFSFAASSTLARQIEAGARYELFLSADRDSLERLGGAMGSAVQLLGNRLALVAAPDADPGVRGPSDLVAPVGEASPWIAVAAPAVPVGRYTREYLAGQGLLGDLEGRFVLGDNARNTLALVESGAAAFGFVYVTDQRASAGTQLRWSSAAGAPPRVTYVAALRRGARARVVEFLDWLGGEPFLSEAERRGFLRPGS